MKTIFTSLSLFVVLLSFGQNTFKTRVSPPYDSNSNSYQYSFLNQVAQLNDGSFVGIGSVEQGSSGGNSYNLYLLKTDANGLVLASKRIADNRSEGYTLTKTTDGGFAVCGYTDTSNAVVIKYKADLSVQWQKTYSSNNAQVIIYKILQTADGGYLMTGGYYNTDENTTVGYLLKTDGSGNVVFSKNYSNSNVYSIYDAAITTDGNYALLSQTQYVSSGSYDTCILLKVNTAGAVLWSRELYGNEQSYLDIYSIKATSDGGIVLGGEIYDPSTDADQTMMAKYNNAGTLLFSKTMVAGDFADNYAYTVMEDKDGGYLFAGDLDAFDADNNYDSSFTYIVKTNASGNLLWTKTLNPSADADGYIDTYGIITTSDGGYAIAGEGYLFNANTGNFDDGSIIYKYNSNFLSCDDTPGSIGSLENYGTSANINAIAADITTTSAAISVSLTDFGNINYICSGNIFPLQLLSFNATLQNKTVAVQWSTANEVNTNYFVVERSKDAASFTALQQVATKGNSAGVQTYAATDVQPMPGTSYYRLKEVDKDGKITYSSIVPVTVLNNGVIVISPNPVRDAIKVVMQSAGNSSITMQVIDMKGSILATQKTSVTTGRNEITLSAASLAKGIYVLKVIENYAVQTVRFVKE